MLLLNKKYLVTIAYLFKNRCYNHHMAAYLCRYLLAVAALAIKPF